MPFFYWPPDQIIEPLDSRGKDADAILPPPSGSKAKRWVRRHCLASAPISAGVDVLTISRRLGHATAAFTLTVYGHLFTNTDAVVAKAIDMAFAAKPS